MGAIYKREFRSYFNSMIGYVIVGMLTLVIALYFAIMNLNNGYPSFGVSLYSTSVFLIVIIPILSMRSFAEERKTKTDQMLLTYPVTVSQIILGKFLALATVFAIPLAISCIYPIIVASAGASSLAVDYATILGYFLVGCMYISLGMLVSAHTENQIISAVFTAVLLFVIYNWKTITGAMPTESRYNLLGLIVIIALVSLWLYFTTHSGMIAGVFGAAAVIAAAIVYKIKSALFASLLANALGFLDVDGILLNFAGYKVFDVSGVILLITITALFLFLTAQSVQKRRWN